MFGLVGVQILFSAVPLIRVDQVLPAKLVQNMDR